MVKMNIFVTHMYLKIALKTSFSSCTGLGHHFKRQTTRIIFYLKLNKLQNNFSLL